MQSDERFAESYMRSRINRGHGPLKIAMELGQRGINEQLIAAILYSGEYDWFDLCRQAGKKIWCCSCCGFPGEGQAKSFFTAARV